MLIKRLINQGVVTYHPISETSLSRSRKLMKHTIMKFGDFYLLGQQVYDKQKNRITLRRYGDKINVTVRQI